MNKKSTSYIDLKTQVLNYLQTLKKGDTNYNFSSSVKGNIYSSIIALYIYDLLGETKKFSNEKKQIWIKYINSYQDKETGYFMPERQITNRPERNYLQLTTFCLSALRILGAKPLVDPPFKEELKNPDYIKSYLKKYNCLEGKRGSGNMAMFLGILLTYFFEDTNDEIYKNNLDKWFDLHDLSVNVNGFWGEHLEAKYYNGVQNGFHQYVIYDYWKREVIKSHEILNILAKTQDFEGHFAPFPGGAACEDYDAIHLLIILNTRLKNRSNQIEKQLMKAKKALLNDLNKNGGFCQTKINPSRINLRNIRFLLEFKSLNALIIKLRKSLGFLIKRRDYIKVDWFDSDRKYNESNLWDTWFKLLAIAEIETHLGSENKNKFKFQEHIGLGNF